MGNQIENNKVTIMGTVCTDLVFNHEVNGKKFYVADVEVKRKSGVSDFIPVTFSDYLGFSTDDLKGKLVVLKGKFRSYNLHCENKSKLILSVLVEEIQFLEELSLSVCDNRIVLEGYVCKKPVYRETPLGRQITDVLIAVNRPYGKSDYIPCIVWGRNARFAESFEIGTKVRFTGRIQSREYHKRLGEFEYDFRTAYEVSVSKLEVICDEEQSN